MRKGRATLAHALGLSRSSLYYVSKKEKGDWKLKGAIGAVLHEHPAYGSRRVALHLKKNRKGIQRVMQRYGIRPYRHRGRKWLRKKAKVVIYANLLVITIPAYPNYVWAADFTELSYRGRVVFVATVIDLFTREILGIAVALRRGAPLTLQALGVALLSHPRPVIFHSDNGKEYEAQAFVRMLEEVGSAISRSHPGCPWENGYQESFYDKFKVDLGDPNRFRSLGELVAEVYRTVWVYNHTRIHSALRMPPAVFAEKHAPGIVKSVS